MIFAGQKENPELQSNDDRADTINKNKHSYWAYSYGSVDFEGEGSAIQQTTDGGYIIAGTIIFDEEKTFNDFWVIKLHDNGTIAWQKAYGEKGYDRCEAIQQTTDGGYIVVGETYSFGDGNGAIWVLKLRNDGTIAWQKTYGGNARWYYASSIRQTTDGGYILSGGTNPITSSYSYKTDDLLVLKLNADGTVEWQRTYSGLMNELGSSIQQTPDGGYILSGQTQLGYRNSDIWLLKLDKNGQIIWQKAYGGWDRDGVGSVQQTSDGGYIVTGVISPFRVQWVDTWILKIKNDGAVEWQKCYGGDKVDVVGSIQQTPDGGYVVAGTTSSFGNGNNDIWVLKLRNDGTVVWQKTYGGKRDDDAEMIQQIPDGYIMVGSVLDEELQGENQASVLKNYSMLVLKIDKDGLIPSIPSLGVDTKVSPQEAKYFPVKESPWESEMIERRYYTYDDTHVIPRNVNVIVKDTNVKPVDTKAAIMKWPSK